MAWQKLLLNPKNAGAVLKKLVNKKSDTITSIKPAKNLTKRRADFEDIVKKVDDTRTRFNLPKTDKSSKIKRDAAIKVSKIHDKYDAIKASGKK